MSVLQQQEQTASGDISVSDGQVNTTSPSDLVLLRVFLLDPEVLAANEEITRSSGCFEANGAAIADFIATTRRFAGGSNKLTAIVVEES